MNSNEGGAAKMNHHAIAHDKWKLINQQGRSNEEEIMKMKNQGKKRRFQLSHGMLTQLTSTRSQREEEKGAGFGLQNGARMNEIW